MQTVSLNHIAIIPDGNRRWARSRNLPTIEGHRRGFGVVEKLLNKIWETEIHTVTLWALSTENLGRSEDELKYLMKIFERLIKNNLKDAIRKSVRIKHLGRKDRIPKSLLVKIRDAEGKTKNFKERQLNIALDYGGRDEIVRAIRKIKDFQKVEENNFNDFLDTREQRYPNPDLVIRTGGDKRTSGFMIWQTAYAEYFFLDKYLPDMTVEDLDNVIKEFLNRERRFGK